MRIGFDAKRIFHNWRGLGNYSRDLVTSYRDNFPQNDLFLYTPKYADQRALEFENSFGRQYIITPESFLGKQIPSVWRRGICNLLKAHQIDLYHGLSHELPSGLRKSGIKSVVTIHDLIFLRYPEYFPLIDRQIYLAKIKHAIKQSDCIISICEQTKNDLIEYLKVNPSKIEVCYQSCNEIYQKGKISHDKIIHVREKYNLPKKFFLFVGALEERKNILNLIEGYSYFGVSYDLVIVGRDREYKKEILRKIRSCDLDNNIHVLTNVEQKDLPALYAGAEIFCFPSFFEGFGIPIIEALFCNTPVITSRGSCFPEVAGGGALYVDPNSAFQIGKAMYDIVNVDNLKQDLILAGQDHVKNFKSQNTTRKLNDVYQMVMNNS